MTDISKEAVDALLQGVTPGPWETVFDRQTWGWLEVDGPSFKIGAPTQATDLSLADEVQRKKDARFIAATRELVPALRAALDEAEARAVKAEAERDAANALLREARTDLEHYVTTEYPKDKHPYYKRQWNRDMELCRRIDAHLGAKP